MLIEVLVGAAVSLVLLVAIIGVTLRRAPLLFVAEKLPEKFYSEDGEGNEFVTGSGEVDFDVGERNEFE